MVLFDGHPIFLLFFCWKSGVLQSWWKWFLGADSVCHRCYESFKHKLKAPNLHRCISITVRITFAPLKNQLKWVPRSATEMIWKHPFQSETIHNIHTYTISNAIHDGACYSMVFVFSSTLSFTQHSLVFQIFLHVFFPNFEAKKLQMHTKKYFP